MHLRHIVPWLGLAAGWLLCPCAAQSQVTLTLDNPDLVVVRPSSGFRDVILRGTVTPASGYDVDGAAVSLPENSQGDFLNGDFAPDYVNYQDQNQVTDAPYSGPLAIIHVNASDPLGLYDLDVGPSGSSDGKPQFQVFVENANFQTGSAFADFSVLVVAVPEPSSLTLLVSTGLTGTALLLRRRARK